MPIQSSIDQFQRLDDDVLQCILYSIRLKSRSFLAQTCKRFHSITKSLLLGDLNLTQEQVDCFVDCMRGQNVFLTGGVRTVCTVHSPYPFLHKTAHPFAYLLVLLRSLTLCA